MIPRSNYQNRYSFYRRLFRDKHPKCKVWLGAVTLSLLLLFWNTLPESVPWTTYDSYVLVGNIRNATRSDIRTNPPLPFSSDPVHGITPEVTSASSSSTMNIPMKKNLHVVIIGDSISRYMYLSLTYYLKTGEWAPRGHTLLEKVKDPDPSAWNDWLSFSNQQLAPQEFLCDCYRYWTKAFKWYRHCENRYYRDFQNNNNNSITFITKFGGNPFHGHWEASGIPLYQEPNVKSLTINQTMRGYTWSYETWEALVHQYLAKLQPKPSIMLFNQGHWKGHELRDPKVLQNLKEALDQHGIRGVYRTTTYRQDERDLQQYQWDALRKHDAAVCRVFECLNVSWTAWTDPEDYVDPVHFKAPINNRMNLQFLSEIAGTTTSRRNN